MTEKELTLALVRNDEQLLLGLKKRGFGKGHWNGFGGKIEEGESIKEAAIRELEEEACIKATELEKRGVLVFEFMNDPVILNVHVFLVSAYKGVPTETEEMKPEWFNIRDIPYDRMWPDDKYWIPLFLDNKKFKGKFIFNDNQVITEHNLQTEKNLLAI